MDLQMQPQIIAVCEATLADRTAVHALLQMCDLVNGQRARLTESLSAIVTFERLILGVNVAMIA